MKNIGITGVNGFIGNHLKNTLNLNQDKYNVVNFERAFFDNNEDLDVFVEKCDVIVHLAGLNRHENQEVIYDTNIKLSQNLVDSLNRVNKNCHVIMSSSSQEKLDNLYGKSKKRSRELFVDWSNTNKKNIFSGLIIPNVFGPFGVPNYNSVIATFCYKLVNGETPRIINDSDLNLIYVAELISEILQIIEKKEFSTEKLIHKTKTIKVAKLLEQLLIFKESYFLNGNIPALDSDFDVNLFNTFRSYLNLEEYFPFKLTQHKDDRGAFTEIIRLGIGGQVSFSTTVPGITRGNHFHTRKVERFAVIKGKALIELRKIGTDKVYEFVLDGNEPSYVDMPIWYTHNIKNIGEHTLLTNFWINEPFDPENHDTYFEIV
jgi:UDP-2-acetamido-2,6-beta-L-arabino-hexul-4-ose reductase